MVQTKENIITLKKKNIKPTKKPNLKQTNNPSQVHFALPGARCPAMGRSGQPGRTRNLS